jgi:hypothetical protein
MHRMGSQQQTYTEYSGYMMPPVLLGFPCHPAATPMDALAQVKDLPVLPSVTSLRLTSGGPERQPPDPEEEEEEDHVPVRVCLGEGGEGMVGVC